MIEIGIDPVIAAIGPFSIRWYSVMIAMAILVATIVGLRETRRRGIADDDVYSFLTWAIIAGIIGSRLFHIIDKLDFYVATPTAIFAFQEGGLAIYGAVVGGLVALIGYAKYRGISTAVLADAVAPSMILGQAIGRVGCMINGDVFGRPTDLPWAVAYTHPNSMIDPQLLGVPTHPAAGYELIWDLIVFAFLWKARKWNLANGTIVLMYFALYSVGRFLITFSRDDLLILLGLSQAQVIALGTIVVAAPLAIMINRLNKAGQRGRESYGQTGIRG
jgi:phosphatidylglycerol:prolipoprotein diacylglycerol transferase